jgi:hypothetical protein
MLFGRTHLSANVMCWVVRKSSLFVITFEARLVAALTDIKTDVETPSWISYGRNLWVNRLNGWLRKGGRGRSNHRTIETTPPPPYPPNSKKGDLNLDKVTSFFARRNYLAARALIILTGWNLVQNDVWSPTNDQNCSQYIRAFTTLETKRGANAFRTPFFPSVVLKLHLFHTEKIHPLPCGTNNKKLHPGNKNSIFLHRWIAPNS